MKAFEDPPAHQLNSIPKIVIGLAKFCGSDRLRSDLRFHSPFDEKHRLAFEPSVAETPDRKIESGARRRKYKCSRISTNSFWMRKELKVRH